jgi:ATP-dependent Lon protease
MPKRKQPDDNGKLFEALMARMNEKEDLLYFKKLTKPEQTYLLGQLTLLCDHTFDPKPKLIRLLETDIPEHYKSIVLKKMLHMQKENTSKLEEWVDAFLQIPFHACAQLPVVYNTLNQVACSNYLNECKRILNQSTYGMEQAKDQFMELIGKWMVNPDSMGTAIALKGPMGTGKTTLIKKALTQILKRPFALIALGGASDGSFLTGHSYTYEGSTYGKIVDVLIQKETSNPILYFDELDKVSQSEKGDEIVGVLTHLTDTTQNAQFHDKYFSEIDLDLSKCLFVFSYNDETLVNPILKDRMYTIEVKGYQDHEKKIIARDFLIPELKREYHLEELEWKEVYTDLILKHVKEEGVRQFKRQLEKVFSRINLLRLSGKEVGCTLEQLEGWIDKPPTPVYPSFYT